MAAAFLTPPSAAHERVRRVTVVLNGRTIIADPVIPGITGGALDSNEGQPGPIVLQGDHGAVEFRRIVLTPARYPE